MTDKIGCCNSCQCSGSSYKMESSRIDALIFTEIFENIINGEKNNGNFTTEEFVKMMDYLSKYKTIKCETSILSNVVMRLSSSESNDNENDQFKRMTNSMDVINTHNQVAFKENIPEVSQTNLKTITVVDEEFKFIIQKSKHKSQISQKSEDSQMSNTKPEYNTITSVSSMSITNGFKETISEPCEKLSTSNLSEDSISYNNNLQPIIGELHKIQNYGNNLSKTKMFLNNLKQFEPGQLAKAIPKKIKRIQHPLPLPPVPPFCSQPTWKQIPSQPTLQILTKNDKLMLVWNMKVQTNRAVVHSYELYTCQETEQNFIPNVSMWKFISSFKADKLPMKCMFDDFIKGFTYYFAIRAVDIHQRKGPFAVQELSDKRRKQIKFKNQNDVALFETKPQNTTILSLTPKHFFNDNNYKQYEENLHSFKEKKVQNKSKLTVEEKKDCHNTNELDKSSKSVIVPNKKSNFVNDNNDKQYEENLHSFKEKKLQNKSKLTVEEKKDCHNTNELDKSSKSVIVPNKKSNFVNDVALFETEPQNTTILSLSSKDFFNDNNDKLYEENLYSFKEKKLQIKSKLTVEEKKDCHNTNELDKSSKSVIVPNKKSNFVNDNNDKQYEENLHSFKEKKLQNKSKLTVEEKKDCHNTIELDKSSKSVIVSNKKSNFVNDDLQYRKSTRKTKETIDKEKQLALEEAILSQNEDGTKMAVFPNKGRGVVANKDFTRGEYVFEFVGELISLKEARKREEIYSRVSTTGCFMYYFKFGLKNYCIDSTAESPRLCRLVNHSRSSNLETKIVEISGTPRIIFISKIDIKKGEELTVDYGDRRKESIADFPWLAH